MSLILRYVIGRQSNPPLVKYPDLKLQQELKDTQKQLNSILTEWNWGGKNPSTAQEFLNKFKPWVDEKLKLGKEVERSQQELQSFLNEHHLNNLGEIKNVNGEGMTNEIWKNTEQDYLKQIQELKKDISQKETTIIGLNNSYSKLDEKFEELKASKGDGEDNEELITERDELARDKKTLEQEVLALNNQVKNKVKEVSSKEKSLETLKKEKDKEEVNHQKQLKEKNGLITTLQREVNQLKTEIEKLR